MFKRFRLSSFSSKVFRCLYRRCPPLPIPNREVKPARANGTAVTGGRVGRCPILNEASQETVEAFLFLSWLSSGWQDCHPDGNQDSPDPKSSLSSSIPGHLAYPPLRSFATPPKGYKILLHRLLFFQNHIPILLDDKTSSNIEYCFQWITLLFMHCNIKIFLRIAGYNSFYQPLFLSILAKISSFKLSYIHFMLFRL